MRIANHNVVGSVILQYVNLFVNQLVQKQIAIFHVYLQKTLNAMLNANYQDAISNVRMNHVLEEIVTTVNRFVRKLNVLLYAR